MTALTTPLSEADYQQIRSVCLAMIEEARQAYQKACAAHSKGELERAELKRLKQVVHDEVTRLEIFENSWAEQNRQSARRAEAERIDARDRAIETIELDWAAVEEAFGALVSGIDALAPHVAAIHQGLDNITRETTPHRNAFGNYRQFGELLHEVREIDFRLSGLVHQALYDAGLGTFVLGIGKMPPAVGRVDPGSALEPKRRTISGLLGQLGRAANQDAEAA